MESPPIQILLSDRELDVWAGLRRSGAPYAEGWRPSSRRVTGGMPIVAGGAAGRQARWDLPVLPRREWSREGARSRAGSCQARAGVPSLRARLQVVARRRWPRSSSEEKGLLSSHVCRFEAWTSGKEKGATGCPGRPLDIGLADIRTAPACRQRPGSRGGSWLQSSPGPCRRSGPCRRW
jgi:hypothetical protein